MEATYRMRRFYDLAIGTAQALIDCLTVLTLLLTGLFIALESQASSPNYHALFQTVSAIAAFHIPFGVLYCAKRGRWLRALVAVVVLIATLSYLEFALRMLR